MAKLKKAITNQVTKEELEDKIKAIDEVEPEIKLETPPEEKETPVELKLEDVRGKEPAELTDEEQTYLEEHSEELTPEEKVKYSIETPIETPIVPESETVTTPEKPEEVDWKSRYRGSTQEAQVLASRNKDLVQSVDEAAQLPEPTDDEMKKEYGEEWELMDNLQKKISRDNLLNKKRFEMVNQAVQKTKKSEEWVEKVKVFTDDPKTIDTYPLLKGKEVEFSQFCSIPSRIGVDFGDLVKAFLFDIPPVRPQRKSLFETKGGGEVTKPKELTVEEIQFLRTNDQKKYKDLVKQGKIKIEI